MTTRSARRLLVRLGVAVVLIAVAMFVLLVFNGVIGGEEDPGSGESAGTGVTAVATVEGRTPRTTLER
jgi:type IV secretory pathway TrbL component